MSEAVPALLAAPALTKAVGAAMAGTGLAGMVMKATKQGQGGRSQPTDYGQGGTAKPRTKNVQRPTGKQPKASYRDRMRGQQRQRAKESHKVKPVKKEFFIKKAPIDMNYRKYNMPIKPATFPNPNPYKVTTV